MCLVKNNEEKEDSQESEDSEESEECESEDDSNDDFKLWSKCEVRYDRYLKKKQKDQERELMHPDEFFFNKPPSASNWYNEVSQQTRHNLLMETLMNKYKNYKS